jgi:hypothetical protein
LFEVFKLERVWRLRSLHSGFRTQEVDENNLRQPGDPVPEQGDLDPWLCVTAFGRLCPFAFPKDSEKQVKVFSQ